MRPRFVVLVSLLAAFVGLLPAATAAARPRHNRGLTIAATPNPIVSGEGVLIYGALQGGASAGQTIDLYHRIAGNPSYSLIGHATTDSHGFYEFTREEGVVTTDRSWFVRGPSGTHSRTVFERVSAVVDLSSNLSATDTGTPVLFSGSVSPAHPFERVALQVDTHEGSGWRTIAVGRTGPASRFAIAHRFRRPGVYTVRARFGGDRRNAAGASDSLTITVQQRQVPGFSIQSSDPVIAWGGTVTISGVLDKPGSNVVEPSTGVTLYEHGAGQPERAVATTVTGTDGGYSFIGLKPTQNEVYIARTTLAPRRHSAQLYEGVSDVVTLSANPTTVPVGAPVTFAGSVTPSKGGELIYLQRKGDDGFWHDVGVHRINADGSYAFARLFAQPGTRQFRTRIYADGVNVGAAAAPVTITVTPAVVSPVSLPPAS